MVTLECLHDGSFLEEFNSLPRTGQLINCLQGYRCRLLSSPKPLCQSLIDHPEGALAQLPDDGYLLPRHLPLIRDIH